jgi:hypothetical protein
MDLSRRDFIRRVFDKDTCRSIASVLAEFKGLAGLVESKPGSIDEAGKALRARMARNAGRKQPAAAPDVAAPPPASAVPIPPSE